MPKRLVPARPGLFILVFLLPVIMILSPVTTRDVALAAADETEADQPSLFVNLTSAELNRAAMAISFATRVRLEKQIPVTIFLNVEGVRLADLRIPAQTYASGQTPQEMLVGFMEAGGTVIACPMCMQNVGGLSEDQLLDGVVVGGSDVTWPRLFADDATVLSY
jgi:predicted peroxiredoxin